MLGRMGPLCAGRPLGARCSSDGGANDALRRRPSAPVNEPFERHAEHVGDAPHGRHRRVGAIAALDHRRVSLTEPSETVDLSGRHPGHVANVPETSG